MKNIEKSKKSAMINMELKNKGMISIEPSRE